MRPVACMVLTLSLVCSSRADRPSAPEPGASSAVLHSTTHRFLAAGPNAALCLQSLLFSEKTTERMERLLGQPLPADPANPLRILFRVDEQFEESMISRFRTQTGTGTIQRILVLNPDQADPEEFLEVLVAELFDRYLWVRRKRDALSHWPAAPEWFVQGLAQNLYPVLREQNRILLRRYVLQGEPFPLTREAIAESHPAFQPRSRAWRGLFFDWLLSLPRFGELLDGWMRKWAEGQSLSVNDMLSGAGLEGRSAEREWHLWLASQRSILHVTGRPDPVDIRSLRNRLRIPALAVPGASPEIARWITPEILLRHRTERWAKEGVRMLQIRLARLKMGAWGTAFHEVVCSYYDVLADAVSPWGQRKWRPDVVEEELIRRLREAEQKRAALEKTVRDQSFTEDEPGRVGYQGRRAKEEAHDDLQNRLNNLEQEYRERDSSDENPPGQITE